MHSLGHSLEADCVIRSQGNACSMQEQIRLPTKTILQSPAWKTNMAGTAGNAQDFTVNMYIVQAFVQAAYCDIANKEQHKSV